MLVAHFYKLEFPLLHSNRESLGISAALIFLGLPLRLRLMTIHFYGLLGEG
nr:MAG TPA: hypothetical protein [Caudoviricetes sp.]